MMRFLFVLLSSITLAWGQIQPDWVDVTDFDEMGSGPEIDASEIKDAVDSLASTGGTVFFPLGTYDIDESVTLDQEQVTLKFQPGAVLTTSRDNIYLTINCIIDAGLYQIFDLYDSWDLRGTPQIEVIHPQWFGAQADDGADDAAAIQDAVHAMRYWLKPVFFPAGEYLVDSTVVVTAYNSRRIAGENAVLKKGSGAHQVAILDVVHPRADLEISGLTFDANGLATNGLRIVSVNASYQPGITLTNCSFLNSVEPSDGSDVGSGTQLKGRFSYVRATGCTFGNIDSDATSNPDTQGLGVVWSESEGVDYYAQEVHIRDCRFELVRNDSSVNSDGLRVTMPEDDPTCTLTVIGSRFINCKGRSIKSQARKNLITGNSFQRGVDGASLPGNLEIDLQRSGGVVADNTFYYTGTDNVPGEVIGSTVRETESAFTVTDNLFHFDGVDGLTVIGFSNQPAEHPLGGVNIANNTVVGNTHVFADIRVKPGLIDEGTCVLGQTFDNHVSIRYNSVDDIVDLGQVSGAFFRIRRSGIGCTPIPTTLPTLRGIFTGNRINRPSSPLDVGAEVTDVTFNHDAWSLNLGMTTP